MPGKLIIAHRGASDEAPENSLEAVLKAMDIGADGIEIDLQLTKDRDLVLFHDNKRKGQKLIDTPSTTLFEAGIPSLEQLLAIKNRKPFLMIELKSRPAIADEMAAIILKKLHNQSHLFLASFCSQTIRALKTLKCPFPLYAIAETPKQLDAFDTVDGYALHYKWDKEPIAREIYETSRLYYWTVDSPTLARRLTAHGIITNKPRLLLKKERQRP